MRSLRYSWGGASSRTLRSCACFQHTEPARSTHQTIPIQPASSSSSTSTTASSSATAAAAPSVFRYYEAFLESEEDPSGQMLLEAHRKHGVWLNVPPQATPRMAMPPATEPGGFVPNPDPERAIPPVRLPRKQRERLAGLELAYKPIHDPPPLKTTGNRALQITFDSATTAGGAAATAAAAAGMAAVTTTLQEQTVGGVVVETVATRHAPDPYGCFHCSACGRAFRLRQSAEAHVAARHTGAADRATVKEGPGPGEIVRTSDVVLNTTPSPRAEAAAAATATDSVAAAGAPAAKEGEGEGEGGAAAAAPYEEAVLSAPSEAEVTRLLLDVWDVIAMQRGDIEKPKSVTAGADNRPVAPAASAGAPTPMWDSRDGALFIPAALVVEGKADRRAEEASEEAKPAARATPQNASPGLRRAGTVLSGRAAAKAKPAVSVREMNKRYPNPFGDSPNAAVVELEKEPVNPFIDLEGEGGGGGGAAAELLPETHEWAAKPFACPLCAASSDTKPSDAPRFRLLSALRRHVRSVHGGEAGADMDTLLTRAQLERLYAIERNPAAAVASEIAEYRRRTLRAAEAEGSSASSSSGTAGGASGGEGGSGSDSGSDSGSKKGGGSDGGSLLGARLTHALAPEDLRVHIRTGNNIVLSGVVVDVQRGFSGRREVLQYVISVSEGATRVGAGEGKKGEVAEDEEDEEEELVVVRCVGDTVPVALLTQQVRRGTTVLVTGLLKLQYQSEAPGSEPHCYPVVQVVPPLGFIKALS